MLELTHLCWQSCIFIVEIFTVYLRQNLIPYFFLFIVTLLSFLFFWTLFLFVYSLFLVFIFHKSSFRFIYFTFVLDPLHTTYIFLCISKLYLLSEFYFVLNIFFSFQTQLQRISHNYELCFKHIFNYIFVVHICVFWFLLSIFHLSFFPPCNATLRHLVSKSWQGRRKQKMDIFNFNFFTNRLIMLKRNTKTFFALFSFRVSFRISEGLKSFVRKRQTKCRFVLFAEKQNKNLSSIFKLT